jgi:hypothetical protein
MDITEKDIELLLSQQEYAKDKLAARWSELSGHMRDMERLMAGNYEDTDNDASLVAMCLETCWAQCTVFWAEMQLEYALKQMKELKDESTT